MKNWKYKIILDSRRYIVFDLEVIYYVQQRLVLKTTWRQDLGGKRFAILETSQIYEYVLESFVHSG
jgi:hypothetical protein